MSNVWDTIRLPDTSQDTGEHIAGLIIGQNKPPNWLVEHVQRWIPCLVMARISDQLQPTRAVLLRRVAAVAEAAQTLAAAIADTPTLEFLQMPLFGPLEVANTQRVLVDVGQRARGVLACPSLVTIEGKPRAGRTKAMPPDALLAKEFCAVMIAETWTHVRGRRPGPRNDAACKAAQALWIAAGGGTGNQLGKDFACRMAPIFRSSG